MTATPSPGQPATPAEALRMAAAKLARGSVWADPFGYWYATQARAAGQQKQLMVDALNDLAAELDTAPTTYALPAAPPPEVTELWDVEGERWQRQHPGVDRWVADEAVVWNSVRTWGELLPRGPLSTVPPAGTEAAETVTPGDPPPPTWNPDPDLQHDPGPPADPSMFGHPVVLPPAPGSEPIVDLCMNCNTGLVRRTGKLVHRDGDPDRCTPPAGTEADRDAR